MRKCLIFKLISALAIFLASGNWCYAVPTDCFLIAGGTYTATTQTAAVAIPRTARRGTYVTHITAAPGGTSPSMTVQYQQNYASAAASFNSTSNTVSTSALTTATVRNDQYITTGNYQMLMPWHRVSLTISGTGPSFTANFYLCYDE